MIRRVFSLLLLSVTMFAASAQIHEWGKVSKIHVEGNHLVDAEGNQMMLHGIMDTPSPYFCGYRFTDNHWIDVYTQGDNYITKCINYFDELFTAVTDTAQGSWCNVFRLHLDPCWTDNPNKTMSGFTTSNGKIYDPNGTEVSGEANIIHFDKSRLTKYLSKLYLKIAEKAKGHGMYVIMRPPGVCPSTIKVGDYYQQYLIDVWDAVTQNQTVLDNSDWLSIELANEPVGVKGSNGQDTNTALHDFFQPIVDKIRENGFRGIIWVPGATWQQEYRPYSQFPITDPMTDANGNSAQQIGYAVHFYPGWYNTSDSQTDTLNSIRSFLNMVPVVKKAPVMITEVDWSPEDPTGEGHYNESGQWVVPNCGTWATGTTSKFGKGYRAVVNYFGNIGWTLTHTHDYLDIDHYRSTGVVRPAFFEKLLDNAYEACSGACFVWYNEYAHMAHSAHEWPTGDNILPMEERIGGAESLGGKSFFLTDPDLKAILFCNSGMNSPQDLKSGSYADIVDNPYCWFKFRKISNPGCETTGNLYTIQVVDEMGSNYSLWGTNGYMNANPAATVLFALGCTDYKYGHDADYTALWKVDYEDGLGFTLQNVNTSEAGKASFVSAYSNAPQEDVCYVRLFSKLGVGIEAIETTAPANDRYIDLFGHIVTTPELGKIYINNGKKIIIR